jgi:hypothetical protein
MGDRVVSIGLLALVSAGSLAALDALRLDGPYFRDTAGRVVLLRGVAVRREKLAAADYDRLRGWGFDVQQIRFEACKLGMAPGCEAEAGYLDTVESRVALGEARGIYSILCAEWTRTGEWEKLWDAPSGWQERYLAGWQKVWARFRGRAAVAGYDVLNEPVAGAGVRGFIHNFLFPLYRRVYAALHEADPAKTFFFQPPLRSDDGEEGLLRSDSIVWAPHFYPPAGQAAERYRWIFAMAERTGGAVLIGEYGAPDGAVERDRAEALLFDSSLASTIKPWYPEIGSDESRLAAFTRPYPQRIAGKPWNFHFDFAARRWSFEWTPEGKGATVVYLPTRQYPRGWRAELGGAGFRSDRQAATGVSGAGKTAAHVSFDFDAQLLSIEGLPASTPQRLVVTPQ